MKSVAKAARARNVAPVPATMGPAGSVSLTRRLKSANRWREQYNPLVALNLPRARFLIESYTRGMMADLQWTMGAPFMGIENSDPDLLALIELRTSAIGELDWNSKTMPEEKAGEKFDQKLADDQAAAIRDAYEGIDNLQEAIEHLAMPTFRGFAHCEKWNNADSDITHLELVDQWNVVRDGLRGQWKYNPDAVMTSFAALPVDNLMDPANFVFREVKRPVNRIALVKFIRANLSDKDWDAFIEIYGIPGGVLIGPPNVPQGREAEYETAAGNIAEGGNGYAPHGSEWHPNEGPRGTNPFLERMKFLSEKLVLAGTSGKLTMLAESGSGNLAGGAHKETFNTLARAEAKKITEAFQKSIDAPLLDRLFPGQPHLAYFELAANEETDIGDVITHAKELAAAGFSIKVDELSERTGYDLTERAPVDKTADRAMLGDPKPGATYAQNRTRARVRNQAATAKPLEAYLAQAGKTLDAANALDLKPIIDRLAAIVDGPDADFHDGIVQLRADMPALAKQCAATDDQVAAWESVLGPMLLNGLASGPQEKTKS